MKSLAVDLDGVIWDGHTPFLKIYNPMFNKKLTVNDINKWGFFPDDIFWSIYEKSSKQILSYKPYKGIFTNLLRITNYFHISFLTHGLYEEEDIENKLETWGIIKGIVYDKIIIEDRTKKKVDHDFDYFIDDNPQMVEDIQKYPEKKLLLYNQPWNRNTETLYNNVIRFNNWNEIHRYFMLVK